VACVVNAAPFAVCTTVRLPSRTRVYRRNVKLKTKLGSSFSYASVERLLPAAFSLDFIGSTWVSSAQLGYHRLNLGFIGSTWAPSVQLGFHRFNLGFIG
jgi:hypothetical protein